MAIRRIVALVFSYTLLQGIICSVLRMMWPGIATYTSGTLLMIVTIISYPVISGCRTLPRDVTNTFTLFLYYTPKLLRKGVELGLRSAGIYVL